MTDEYERRKDWLIPAINGIKGFKCAMPEGAFYAFVDAREMLGERFSTSADIAKLLLDEAKKDKPDPGKLKRWGHRLGELATHFGLHVAASEIVHIVSSMFPG